VKERGTGTGALAGIIVVIVVVAVVAGVGIYVATRGGGGPGGGSTATLVSIAITPVNPSIAVGNTEQFAASSTYSDGTTHNITTQVTWNSSHTSVATVNSSGLATAVAAGTATITATSGSISGSTTLTVTSGGGGGGESSGLSITSCNISCENVSYDAGYYGVFVLSLYVRNDGNSSVPIYTLDAYEGGGIIVGSQDKPQNSKIIWETFSVDGVLVGPVGPGYASISPGQTTHITASSEYNLTTAGFGSNETYYLTVVVGGGTMSSTFPTVLATTSASVHIPIY